MRNASVALHRSISPEAPLTSDEIKANICVVYILQAASMRWIVYGKESNVESVIIVGYVIFRLKLNLEAILERKTILPQKIPSGHQHERSASGLC